LTVRGKRISQDKDGFLSLTDMWRASGESENKYPPTWRRLPTTRVLMEALHQNLKYFQVIQKTRTK